MIGYWKTRGDIEGLSNDTGKYYCYVLTMCLCSTHFLKTLVRLNLKLIDFCVSEGNIACWLCLVYYHSSYSGLLWCRTKSGEERKDTHSLGKKALMSKFKLSDMRNKDYMAYKLLMSLEILQRKLVSCPGISKVH